MLVKYLAITEPTIGPLVVKAYEAEGHVVRRVSFKPLPAGHKLVRKIAYATSGGPKQHS